jgi:mRNA interferase RelE/StbE
LPTKKYEVKFKAVARKRLANLDSRLRLRILKAVFKLADNPYPPGVKRLVGKSGLRIRVGDYRVVYEVNNSRLLVLVVKVGHRREIYR